MQVYLHSPMNSSKSRRADPGTDGTRDEQRPGNRVVAEELRATIRRANRGALRMKTSNTLIRIAFVIEADDYLIVRKRTLFYM